MHDLSMWLPMLTSTLGAEQMQVLHRGGFTPEERELYREVLFSNTIQTMQVGN